MPYHDVARMAANEPLNGRFIACAATEGEDNPASWVGLNIWQIVAAPQWDEQWAYAIASGKTEDQAGADAGVITDGQILSQVQMLRAEAEPK